MCVRERVYTYEGIYMQVVSLLIKELVFMLSLIPFVIVCKTAISLFPFDSYLTRKQTYW